MNPWLATAGATIALAGIGPRLAVRALRKDPHTPVERFGFHVHEAGSRRRIAEIIEAFFTGYNAALAGLAPAAVRARCEALPAVLHPFAFEGGGMGYGARGLFDWRARPGRIEDFIAATHPGWRFMDFVGLGIWTAFVGAWLTRRVAAALPDARMAGLVYDGFGFKCGFFHRVHDAAAHRRLDAVPAGERAEALRGYGRSLWFVFRDDLSGLEQAVTALPASDRDAVVTGIGLAVTFTAVDDLAAVLRRLDALPAAWSNELVRGARLALYVRHAGQPEALAGWIAQQPEAAAETWRAHLAHAVRAYESTIERPTFLRDFTRECA